MKSCVMFLMGQDPRHQSHAQGGTAASKSIDRRRTNNLSPDKLWHFVCLCFGSSLSSSTSMIAMNFRWICILASMWMYHWLNRAQCLNTWDVSFWSPVCAHTFTWYPARMSRLAKKTKPKTTATSKIIIHNDIDSIVDAISKWISFVCFCVSSYCSCSRIQVETYFCLYYVPNIHHQFFSAAGCERLHSAAKQPKHAFRTQTALWRMSELHWHCQY